MGGPSHEDLQRQRDISAESVATSKEQRERSAQLFNLTFPYLETAGAHYKALSSGDPNALFREIAPGAEGITQNVEAAKERIRSEAPRGGESRLALEQADIAKSSDIGNLIAKSYLSSFPALAALSSGGIGASINEIANAISGLGVGGKIAGDVSAEKSAGKASTMGFLGSLAGAAGQAAGGGAFGSPGGGEKGG